jgi:hypothetical protein
VSLSLASETAGSEDGLIFDSTFTMPPETPPQTLRGKGPACSWPKLTSDRVVLLEMSPSGRTQLLLSFRAGCSRRYCRT